jgi:hypothetical protein
MSQNIKKDETKLAISYILGVVVAMSIGSFGAFN